MLILQERIKNLNNKNIIDNPFVVYWMQCSQRVEYNHALEYAISRANELKKPLIVYFGLTDNFPEASERHYYFMLQGLKEVKLELAKKNIKMIIRKISPQIGALEISSFAALMVVDRGYLRIERQWRSYLSQNAKCTVVQVETNVIVPIEEASQKEEYSAAYLRRKISKKLEDYILPLRSSACSEPFVNVGITYDQYDIEDIDKAICELSINKEVKRVPYYMGGTRNAKILLEDFITNKLSHYSELKNEPGLSYDSSLSPYLHFGQISPLYIYMKLMDVHIEDKKDFLEELIIRRELSMNFVFYNDEYDSYESLPSWAKNTLEKHSVDYREFSYSLEELEDGKTHDLYWNAAQKEMTFTGKMHGYMRMYWGKKILEWSKTPQEAFKTAIYLNNKYLLDGRDANGFAGVAWCFGKHDRPWGERNIFGMVRYMNDKGLKRKFDMDRYLHKIEAISSGYSYAIENIKTEQLSLF
ncbi:deoxyribodipyrimidine photo-lyase [Clostridium lacusfryxellense]|uniref:deoxyribodipyrimidine photo-lyase n=1 Tax=Clostridium lacusfryxellense TaxID=205328 RepID=UPI001FE72200|nr:deoxyribodipyrimidine photo-lyase [Clostridium lacusfryxellense]